MSEGNVRREHPGGPSFSALQRVGSPARLWQPQGRSGTMNTLADCAIARHGDEVSSASISLQPALTAPRQARAFTRQSLYRWGEDEQLIEAVVLVVCSHPDALRAEVRDGSGMSS